jgi:hypothetical protein
MLLHLRGISERALARPVTHAVIAIAPPVDPAIRQSLALAAAAADLVATRTLLASEAAALVSGAPPAHAAAHGAAIAAEDDALHAAQHGSKS